MTATTAPGGTAPAPGPAPSRPPRARRPTPGWRIVAGKEFTDYLVSVRFTVLILLVGLAAVASVQAAANGLRDVAPQASELASPFLRLFTVSPERIPSFFALVGFLGPLLGIAFGFDAVNGERAQGTLPRLAAQPIYRDDIINGKFVAGLGLIAVTLVALAAVVAGLGILRLGTTPGVADVLRLLLFLAVSFVYIGVWLAAAILCSVVLRRAATSALVVIAAWLVFTLFAGLITGLLADAIAPVPDDPTGEDLLRNARLEQTLERASPSTLYDEAATVLLSPEVRTLGFVTVRQLDRAVPGSLPLPQSLLLVWPQVVALVGFIVVLFALAYVAFLRQEIRA